MSDGVEARINRAQFAALQRDLRTLPKEASREMRLESKDIAKRIMKPALDRELGNVPIWGPRMRDSGTVWVVSDRIPKVKVGSRSKKAIFSGGANGLMLRWPTNSGSRGKSFAPFQRTDWLGRASKEYTEPAFDAWAKVVEKICRKFNAGGYR